ncbi:MAG: hypothetical protein ACREMY_09745, partial [bacterium]
MTAHIYRYASCLWTMGRPVLAGTKKGTCRSTSPDDKPKKLLGGSSNCRGGLGGGDLRLRPANHAAE